jgi:predicted AlkP superfamily phosphohydrolase/phosphomutase
MIGGVAIPRGARFVHPRGWASELERRAPFPVNGMEWGRFEHEPEALIEDAKQLVEERTASYKVLLEGNWTVAACVYLAPDRLQHPFGAYLLPSHPEYERRADTPVGAALREVYRTLDARLGELADSCGPQTTVVLMSDHGFRPINRTWNVNRLLQELGFATPARAATGGLRRSSTVRWLAGSRLGFALRRRVNSPSKLDWSRTLAYESTLDGGISLNVRGRESDGVVAASDYERIVSDVGRALLEYVDPATGDHPVARVRLKDELPSGPFLDLAPDVIAEPAPLKDFGHTRELAAWTAWPSGDHRREGIVLASGGRTSGGDLGTRDITDIAATALAFAEAPSGRIDGAPISEIAGRATLRDELAEVSVDRGSRDEAMSEEDDAYVSQHLRDLGYIE